MTTARETIKQALRESNLLFIAGAASDDQNNEGLGKLNTLIQSVFGFETGTKLTEWPVGSTGTIDYTSSWTSSDWSLPPPNVRLMVNEPTSQIIILPAYPDNGARIGVVDLLGDLSAHPITLDPNGKKIGGTYGALIVNVDDANLEWMYRSDLGDWKLLTILAIDDELPFPIQFDDYFQTMLAARLNPRYGRSLTPETTAVLTRSLGQLRATYRQKRSVRAPEAVLRLPNTGQGGIVDDQANAPCNRDDIWMTR